MKPLSANFFILSSPKQTFQIKKLCVRVVLCWVLLPFCQKCIPNFKRMPYSTDILSRALINFDCPYENQEQEHLDGGFPALDKLAYEYMSSGNLLYQWLLYVYGFVKEMSNGDHPHNQVLGQFDIPSLPFIYL